MKHLTYIVQECNIHAFQKQYELVDFHLKVECSNVQYFCVAREKYCRVEVKIAQGLVGRVVSLVWGREIPSREAMAPFWNPLRGESNPPGVCPLLQGS